MSHPLGGALQNLMGRDLSQYMRKHGGSGGALNAVEKYL